MSEYKIINSDVVNLYDKSNFQSEVITQGLLWENVEIINKVNNWYKIRQWDNYESFIYYKFVVDGNIYVDNNLHDDSKWYVVNKRIIIASSLTDTRNKFITFGTVIPIIDSAGEDMYVTLTPDNNRYYVHRNDLFEYAKKHSLDDIAKYSLDLLGTPYFWGGKSGFGYDCSGLIQTLYRLHKIILPRDAKDQIKLNNLVEVFSNFIKGDLIFFNEDNKVNHVGMFIDENKFIHSSGYVKINSINKKDGLYDDKLYMRLLGVFRIQNDI